MPSAAMSKDKLFKPVGSGKTIKMVRTIEKKTNNTVCDAALLQTSA